MNIFQMSLSASVLIIAVVIIRALALHKVPKKTFLVLWGIVICRLLVPFSISSRFSFYTGIDMARRMLTERTTGYYPLKMTSIPNMVKIPVRGEAIGIGLKAVSISEVEIIWMAGMFACALFFIMTYVKCHKEFKTSLPVENEFVVIWLREHSLHRPVQIRQSDKIKAPLTYGVLRPLVLLPKGTDWTNEVQLRYILTHEFVHIRRFDALTKLLLAAAVSIHWFNPFVWVMYVLANRDIELSCDEMVVQTFGETMKSAYALTLIGLEEKKSMLSPLVNNFSKNFIEERIVSIMKMKKTSFIGMFLAIALVIGTTVVFVTNAASANDKESNGAFESNISLSDKEVAKQELERKKEIAKQYLIYSKYGLTYNQEKDRFFYNGELVRFFGDKLDDNGNYNSFSYTDGTIDLRGVRNTKYELTGIEQVSQEEFDQRTVKIQASNVSDLSGAQEDVRAGSNNTVSATQEVGEPNKNTIDVTKESSEGTSLTKNKSATSEVGEPNYVDNSLNAYIEQGISYDEQTKVWMYQDKPIRFLYDGEYKTFQDNSSLAREKGLSWKVVRNANESIERLTEMTETEVNDLLN